MPELPEVEVVRRGLERFVAGRKVRDVEVRHPRAVRRHAAGGDDLAARLAGGRIAGVHRRGKFLWLPIAYDDSAAPPEDVLVAHLGMSGQLLVEPETAPDEIHLRVRVRFDDGGRELRFVDQRTFGGLALDVSDPITGVPLSVRHIARDPLDPLLDDDALAAAVRARRTELKRALLDQSLVSGIGNIYADEALWRARLHGRRRTETLTRAEVRRVLAGVREVMTAALAQGGTSFDSLYVDVNGSSGYFDRALAVYGQQGRPCPRCGALVVREPFMNRSSHRCPVCQPAPRGARRLPAGARRSVR